MERYTLAREVRAGFRKMETGANMDTSVVGGTGIEPVTSCV